MQSKRLGLGDEKGSGQSEKQLVANTFKFKSRTGTEQTGRQAA